MEHALAEAEEKRKRDAGLIPLTCWSCNHSQGVGEFGLYCFLEPRVPIRANKTSDSCRDFEYCPGSDYETAKEEGKIG